MTKLYRQTSFTTTAVALQLRFMQTDWLSSHASAARQRYARTLARARQLPPRGARPLTIAARVAGWITGAAADSLRSLPCVRVAHEAVHIAHADTPRAQLDAMLAQMAQRLRAAGCLHGWRDELLDVIAEGQSIAALERSAMRPLGLLTRAVHLNAWTPDGALWAAQRAPTKPTDPGLWDTLVGGLCAAGESLHDTLLRESGEEAGLQAADLAVCTPPATILRMHRRLPEGMQIEDVVVSECVLPASVTPVNRDGEVSCIRALPPETLWDMMHNDAFTIEAELVILSSLLGRIHEGSS